MNIIKLDFKFAKLYLTTYVEENTGRNYLCTIMFTVNVFLNVETKRENGKYAFVSEVK